MFPASAAFQATKTQKSTGQMRAIVSSLVNQLRNQFANEGLLLFQLR